MFFLASAQIDFKTADRIANAILSSADMKNFFSNWQREVADIPRSEFSKISGDINWLASKLKPGDASVKENLRLFLAGVGSGRVGLRTLDAAIEDLKRANPQEINGSMLRSFMCYQMGDEKGSKRMAISPKTPFSVQMAMAVAEGKIVISKGGAGSGIAGNKKGGAGGSGSAGAVGEKKQQAIDFSALASETENILAKANSLYLQLPPPSSISTFKGIMNEPFFGAFGISNFEELRALYADVQAKFGAALRAGNDAKYEAKGGNADKFSEHFAQASSAYREYLGAVASYRLKFEQYDMGFSQYFSRILDAAMLFAIPNLAGSVALAARGGVGLAQAAKSAGQTLISKAAWKRAVVASAAMSGLFTGAEVYHTSKVNAAMDEFVKDPVKSLNNVREGLQKYKGQLKEYDGADKHKLEAAVDAALQSLEQAEKLLEGARADNDWKAVALYFAQSFATFLLFEMGFRALHAAVRPPAGSGGGPAGGSPALVAPYSPPKPKINVKKIRGFEDLPGIGKREASEIRARAKKEFETDPEIRAKHKSLADYESKTAKTAAQAANVHEHLLEADKNIEDAFAASEAPRKVEQLKREAKDLRTEAAKLQTEAKEGEGKLRPEEIQQKKEAAEAKEAEAKQKEEEALKLSQVQFGDVLQKFQEAKEFKHIEEALADLANRLRGRKVTESMLMAIKQLTGVDINLQDPQLKSTISDIRSVAEDCIKSTASDNGKRVYLWRDGAFFWFADQLLSGKQNAKNARSLIMPRALLTGPDFGFNYGKQIVEDLSYKAGEIITQKFGSLAAPAKQAKHFEIYSDLFGKKFDSDAAFRESTIKLYEYMKANGSVDVGPDGKILAQNFIAADSGFVGIPPFVKTVIEFCSVRIDGLPKGAVKGSVYFHTSHFDYLPHLENMKSGLGQIEGQGENTAFLDPTSKLKSGTFAPDIQKGGPDKVKRSLAFFMAIAAEINKHEPAQ